MQFTVSKRKRKRNESEGLFLVYAMGTLRRAGILPADGLARVP